MMNDKLNRCDMDISDDVEKWYWFWMKRAKGTEDTEERMRWIILYLLTEIDTLYDISALFIIAARLRGADAEEGEEFMKLITSRDARLKRFREFMEG